MPLSIVDCHLEFGLNGRTSGKFTFEVVENDRFTDGNNQLLVAIVVVNSEEDRIDPLGRPQSGHDTQILGKSLLKHLGCGHGEDCPLCQAVCSIWDAFTGSPVANSGGVDHS